MMKLLCWLFVLVIASSLAAALPDEATGLVTYVTDGDTFTVEGLGDVRLADINCPELDAPGGPEAKEFTRASLLNRQVYLDIDDKVEKDRYGRYICVAYLSGPKGTADPGQSFNRMLVDSGHAIVEDAKDNEFNPADWWASAENPQNEPKKFVGSIKSDKYHYPDCQWAKKIKPENEIWFTSSEDAGSQHYVPCGVCHPP
jgi:micrococcal nuclease